MTEESVYHLLNKLCFHFCEKDLLVPRRWQPLEPALKKCQRALRMLRRKCFEILLSKTSISGAPVNPEEMMFDIIYRVVELSWEGRCKDGERMACIVKEILDEELHIDKCFASILHLLLLLKDCQPDNMDLEPITLRYEMLELCHPHAGQKPCTILQLKAFDPPAWMERLDMPKFRGYLMENGSFSLDVGPGRAVDLAVLRTNGTGSDVPLYQMPLATELSEQRGLQIPKLPPQHHEVDEGYEGSLIVSSCSGTELQQKDLSVWEEALRLERPRLRKWECPGRCCVVPERPFLSEAGKEVVNYVCDTLHRSDEEGASPGRLVSHSELVGDLVHLLIGVSSHSFPYDEEAESFVMAAGLSTEGMSSEALSSVCGPFLEAGSSCRRLLKFSSSCPRLLDQLQGKGLVMQALQHHVCTFLQFHCGASLLMPIDRPLLSLLIWAEGLITKVREMANLCHAAVLPDPSLGLSAGMALVAYLYDRLSSEARPDVCCMIYSALHACATVYFRFLQRWIFEGVIQDSCGEFFIQPVVTAAAIAHTRKEWSQQYQLVERAVPGFLRGLQEDILLCGKTVHLLKLCCPKAPLCVTLESGYPSVPCCLHGRDVQQLAAACAEFDSRVRELVGTPPVRSAADLWPKSELSDEQFALQAAVQQARHQNLLKSKLEVEAGRQLVLSQQQQWRLELQEQAQLVLEQRREMRDQELLEERQQQAIWKHQQDEEDQRKEHEKQRLVEYYEELSEMAEKRKHHAEWRMERMRLSEKREEFLLSERREWKTLAELNRKNAERGAGRQAGALEVIEEDAAAPKARPLSLDLGTVTPAPPSRTDAGDVYVCSSPESVANVNNSQLTPNNNKNHVIYENNNFHEAIPNLLDTTNENITVGNCILFLNGHVVNDISAPKVVGVTEAQKRPDRSRHKIVEKEKQGIVEDQTDHPDRVRGGRGRCMFEEHVQERGEDENDSRASIRSFSSTTPDPDPLDTLCNTATSADTAPLLGESQWHDNTNQRQQNRWNMLHGDINCVTGSMRSVPVEGTEEAETAETAGSDRAVVPASGDQVDIMVSPDEPMSVTKSDSSNSVNVFKSASALSSKNNSSYNIASMTTSSSFDLGSGKLTLTTPTSADGSVDAFKSTVSGASSSSNISGNNNNNNNSTRKSALAAGPVAFWKSVRLSNLSAGAEEAKIRNGKDQFVDEELSEDFMLVNVALQKSVVIPLRTQLRLANEAVLRFFFEELDLRSHCVSFRSYLLMTDGEYSHTMTCDLFHKMATVKHPSDLLNIIYLNELLRRSLSASLGGKEENMERLSFKVQLVPERFVMTTVDVVSCLSLRYRVEWPLNIIFTENALIKYSDIFSFLLKVRLVSWALEDTFHQLKEMGGMLFEQPGCLRLVHLWRHEMTLFVHTLQGYIMSAALQTSWVELERDLAKAYTLDKLYTIHVNYVKRILQRCLLSKQFEQLLAILMEIFNYMLRFHEQLLVKPMAAPMADPQLFHILQRLHHKCRKTTSLFYSLLCRLMSTSSSCSVYLKELFEALSVNSHYASLSSSSFPSASIGSSGSQTQLCT